MFKYVRGRDGSKEALRLRHEGYSARQFKFRSKGLGAKGMKGIVSRIDYEPTDRLSDAKTTRFVEEWEHFYRDKDADPC